MSAQAFNDLAVLLQLMQTTRNLAQSMVSNAKTHLAWLGGKLDGSPNNPTLTTIAQAMNDCATSYLNIYETASTWVTNNNATASSAVALIGATISDLSDYASPLSAAATTLQAADKSTTAKAQAACNALISEVSAPPSIWGY